MKLAFRGSFLRDVKEVCDPQLRSDVRKAILALEAAESLRDVAGVKKLSGSSGYYRMKVRDYRIGFALDDAGLELVRLLPRKAIYRYFP